MTRSDDIRLSELGWDSFFEINFQQFIKMNYSPLRIIRENREQYIAVAEKGEFICDISGKYRFETETKSGFPAVGDWVAAEILPGENHAIIHALLPRKTSFSRKVAGPLTEEQIVAANIDIVFIVTGLDLNYNPRRIERFLSLALESGARPVILLTKSDLCHESEDRKKEIESISPGIDVHVLSSLKKNGMDVLYNYIQKGKTAAFLGSSGAGKSTIINILAGEELLRVNEVSETGSRGRHTTTFRELIFLPGGGMVIDTPGLREIQVWGDEEGLALAFNDIEILSQNCRFKDCRHEQEPGCAVQDALNRGQIDKKRFENYMKLKKEFAWLHERQRMKAGALEKLRWKDVSKKSRQLKKERNKNPEV